MKPLDELDTAILEARAKEWNAIEGPRVGDWCNMPDGTLRRFTHDWGADIQTTVGDAHPCSGDASFYFCGDSMSFSGSLDRPVPKASLVNTGELRPAPAWFFHHGQAGAHRGVYFLTPARVFTFSGVFK